MSESLLVHRILFLSEPINDSVANRLIGHLLLLDAQNQHAPIDLYINSPGGSVLDGLAIIDTMLCIQAPITTICLGKAISMAAWILAAGSKGQRKATPHAEIMIHQLSAGIQGEADDIEVYARRIKRQQEELIKMLAHWTGQNDEKIRQDINLDYYMTAQEAKAYGLIDEILQPYKWEENKA
ncbi:ATP-dependent Clp protease proteolytic subunit [Calditrichota bacterium LG25]